MKEILAEIARQLAELTAEVRASRADTKSLKESTEGEIESLRAELRGEVKAIRGDLALITSRQNSEIAGNKKKSTGWLPVSAVSTGD